MGDKSLEINRRDMLGAVASVAWVAALAGCTSDDLSGEPQRPPGSRPTTRALVDVHVHAGITAASGALAVNIHSAGDYAVLRSRTRRSSPNRCLGRKSTTLMCSSG